MDIHHWTLQMYFLSLTGILNTLHVDKTSAQAYPKETSKTSKLVYKQRELLNSDSKGLYGVLQWTLNWNKSTINFNLTKEVKSPKLNIALGLSKTRSVETSDFFILTGNLESSYIFVNMLGSSKNTIKPNSRKPWKLDSVNNVENQIGSNISVLFSRDINTCDILDETDTCINNDMSYILWGSSDNFSVETQVPKKFIPEGHIRVYLTDPQMPPPSLNDENNDDIRIWRVTRSHLIPKTRHTSYYCNIKRGPILPMVHHIIGYVPYFADSTSETHAHHQLLYRCKAPPGVDAAQLFDPFLNYTGEECYLEETHQLPSHFCSELIYAWNRGGKPFYFPANVGIPLGETKDEYFVLEIHYDNSDLLDNLAVESGVSVLYSPKVRPLESSILLVGAGNFGLYIVPPKSVDFEMGGLCSSDCTKDMLSDKGATKIIAANLHAHMATHKIRLRHFRGNKELSWILSDDNYDASFQIMRHLNNPVKIMPGDQLGVECVMSSGNKTVLSGFSTRDEMCFAFLFLDKRLDYLYCSSEYPTGKTLDPYGIQKIGWDKELQERVIKKANKHPEWVGRTLQSVLDNDFGNWTDKSKIDFEWERMSGVHDSLCPPVGLYGKMFYDSYTNRTTNIEMWPNIATVSTPGYKKAECKWPQTSRYNQVASSSGSYLFMTWNSISDGYSFCLVTFSCFVLSYLLL